MPLEFLPEIPFDMRGRREMRWTFCVMVRVEGDLGPYFVTPSDYLGLAGR